MGLNAERLSSASYDSESLAADADLVATQAIEERLAAGQQIECIMRWPAWPVYGPQLECAFPGIVGKPRVETLTLGYKSDADVWAAGEATRYHAFLVATYGEESVAVLPAPQALVPQCSNLDYYPLDTRDVVVFMVPEQVPASR